MFSMEARQQRRGQVDGTVMSPLAGVRLRVLALLAFAVVAFAMWAAPSAQAGTFKVSQCNAYGGGARAIQTSLWYAEVSTTHCNGTGGYSVIGSPNHLMGGDTYSRYRLSLPSSMPNTTIADFSGSWFPQPNSTHTAYFWLYAGGTRVATATSDPWFRALGPLPRGLATWKA